MKTPNTCNDLFIIYKYWHVYRAELTFLFPIEEMDFSLVLLFYAVLLVTVLFIYFCFKRQQ